MVYYSRYKHPLHTLLVVETTPNVSGNENQSVKRQGERMRKIDCDHCKYCLECAELEKSKKEREICLKKERKKYPHL